MTRRSQQQGGGKFFAEIALVLIDEVHLLAEPGRGCALEAGVISRIKMLSTFPELQGVSAHVPGLILLCCAALTSVVTSAPVTQFPISRVRFVAVSATIPNVKDIADWLLVPPPGLKVYGEEMRPCKLRTVVRGYVPSKNDFMFERRLNDFLWQIVAEHSKGRPALVFCRRAAWPAVACRSTFATCCCSSCRSCLCAPGSNGSSDRLKKISAWLQIMAVICCSIGFGIAGFCSSLPNTEENLIQQESSR
jgi:ATP-dependent DNA helicase HFM1/MER3